MDRTDFSCPLDIRAVRITDEFWGGEQELVRMEVLPYQWEALNDRVPGADPSFCMRNFRTAGRLLREAREQKDFVPPVYSFRGFNALPEEGKEPDPDKFYGFVFQDSDFAKWIEAVGYSLALHPDAELERTADEAIDIVCAAQAENGYLDTYYIINGMDRIFTNLKDHHELYCFGHLTEGAISYYQATGKDKLLNAAERYADFVYSRFGPEEGKSKGYPGHEIAEMALMRLYELTGKEKYLRLGSFFLDQRGTQPYYFDEEQRRLARLEGRPEPVLKPQMRYQYYQAHLPVREQSEAFGHAVRAVYLYSGMADAARLNGDEAMYAACRRLWDNIVEKKLYVTGGIGATHLGEAFSFPYDLPNDTAYSETCAAIGLVFFARRMLELHADSRYGDVMEQALYNTVLAGMALDGRSFFYVNPLEVWPEASRRDDRKAHVKASRQKWFGCACCPPNIARLVSSLGQYIVTENVAENTLYWHLYVGGTVETKAGGGMTLETESAFPWDGHVCVRVAKRDTPGQSVMLAFRMPGWCANPDITAELTDATKEALNGLTDAEKRQAERLKDGYQYLTADWHEGDVIRLNFPMEVRILQADTRVREDIGKVAFARGPLVYCIEEADNGKDLHLCWVDGKTLEAAAMAGRTDGPTAVWNLYGIRTGSTVIRTGGREYTITTLLVPGLRERISDTEDNADGLYHAYRLPVCDPVTLTMIPYYAWNNRGEGEMQVWVRV